MEQRSDGERLVKLALCVKAHPGITFADIRRALPAEYGSLDGHTVAGEDAAARRRWESSLRRRFERDKESLRSYGVYLVSDDQNRYSIDEHRSYAAPVELTDAQASLLRLLCSALLDDESYPLKTELRMVLAKIGDDIGAPDLLPSMEGNAPRDGRPMAGLKKIRKSLASRKRLHFEYRDAKGRRSVRDVEPFGCFFLDKNCYVVAFDPEPGADRVFRLDRMSKMSVNAKSPATPDFDPRAFDASEYYGLPFQFGSEDYVARVRFDAENAWRARGLARSQGTFEQAPVAPSDTSHLTLVSRRLSSDEKTGTAIPSAERGDGEPGGLVWDVRVRDTAELVRWCIENGPGIEPVDPVPARDAYIRGIRACLETIDKGMDGKAPREHGEKTRATGGDPQ